jgi:hypothetical protein
MRGIEETFMQPIKRVMRAAGCVGALLFATQAAAMTIFSGDQFVVPESISLVPDGFGDFGGKYFIPDAATNNIWVVPSTGGSPTPFLSTPVPSDNNNFLIGGLFLPSGWGANSGKFLVAGEPLLAFDSQGSQVTFDPALGAFTTPIIAPAGTSFGDDLFVSDQNNVIWRAAPGGSLTQFKNLQGDFFGFAPFGLEFTPDSGSFGNSLLISDGGSSLVIDGKRFSPILALSSDGTPRLFATVPLEDSQTGSPSQNGLRQMVMAPDDYFKVALGIPGELLLVSVAGSRNGGGVLGDIVALDLDGTIVASLRDDLGLTKFDPRGMLFTADGNLLISDTSTSDPIWEATASDFQRAPASVPAPATLALMAFALAGLAGVRSDFLKRR